MSTKVKMRNLKSLFFALLLLTGGTVTLAAPKRLLFFDKLFRTDIVTQAATFFTHDPRYYFNLNTIEALYSVFVPVPGTDRDYLPEKLYLDANKKLESIDSDRLVILVRDQIANNPRAVKSIFDSLSVNICEGAKAGLAKTTDKEASEYITHLKTQLRTAKLIQQDLTSAYSQAIIGLAKNGPQDKLAKDDLLNKVDFRLRKIAFNSAKTNKAFDARELLKLSKDQRAYYEAAVERYNIAFYINPNFNLVYHIPNIDEIIQPHSFAGFLIRRCLQAEAAGSSCAEIMNTWVAGVEKVQTLFNNNCQ